MDRFSSAPAGVASHWSVTRLNATMPIPEVGSGLAILRSGYDVQVAHASRKFALRAGDLAIVDRAQSLRIAGDDGWSAHLLDLGHRRMAAPMEDRSRFVAMPFDGTSPLASIIKRAWAIGDDIGAIVIGDGVIDGLLAALLADLAGKLVADAIDLRLPGQSAKALERAQALIEANLADSGFGVSDLADRMRISSRRLSSLFAKLGITTTEAILVARLERGKVLLSDPSASSRQIAGIARACGFGDQGYFARRFREKFGMSPRLYRESLKVCDGSDLFL